jgi:hypothetical protein
MNMNIAPPIINSSTESLEDSIKAKILHILKIYPHVSPSMLQVGLGSSLPSKAWRPVLEAMLTSEEISEDVIMATTAGGRHQTYTVIRLTSTPQNTLAMK